MAYFILVDCNNFYVSCERLFNPKLEGKPVIVLSNNDGCVVARSQEAKSIGIKMGEPYFKIKDACVSQNVHVFSSNYSLYGDISKRVMTALAKITPDIQVYSIDEAFLTFPDSFSLDQLFEKLLTVRKTIKKHIGIPVSIGIARTKTLAKIANDYAKKDPHGVFEVCSMENYQRILQNYPVSDLWGVGERLADRLHRVGIRTADHFRTADNNIIKKKLGVVGERMLWELNEVSCLPLEEIKPKKSMTYSRSFSKIVTELQELECAISVYANNASVNLREEQACAQALYVFLEELIDSSTGYRQTHANGEALLMPTNDSTEIITRAKYCIRRLYKKGKRYKKCGIVLLDLLPENNVIPDLFFQSTGLKKQTLNKVVDQLNDRFGKNTLFYGAMGTQNSWMARFDKSSHVNLSKIKSLPIVLAK